MRLLYWNLISRIHFMPPFPPIVLYSLTLAVKVKYPLIFAGMLIEGPIVMVACGFFLRFGVFDLLPLFLVLLAGDLVADIGWYYVGYYFAEPLVNKHGKFLGVTPEVFEKVKTVMLKYQTAILLGSKITIGFGLALATVITAGAIKIPIKKYLIVNLIGESILVAILLYVGFFFGQLYTSIADSFKVVFTIAGIVFISLVVFGFSRYMRQKTFNI